jgi:FkbM family methyltransferase
MRIEMVWGHGAAWALRRVLHKFGVDLVPYRPTRHPIARRLRLFAHHGIDFVLDIGANGGQYGQFLRKIGFSGDILSFEPLPSAFAALECAAVGDPRWGVRRIALGEENGTAILNVAQNSESSSILSMLPTHLEVYPDSRYVGTEEVPVGTLEEVIAGVASDRGIFLKVDTQGFESRVINGAGPALSRIRGVQLEMSVVPLYEGELLLPEMVSFMAGRGLTLMAIEPGGADPRTGQLLQVDGLFFRCGSAGAIPLSPRGG